MKTLGYTLLGLLVLIVAVIASVYLFSDKTTPATARSCAQQNQKIVAFGDSLVAGYGSTQGNDFPSLLSKLLGVPVMNLGRSGDTTAQALDRLGEVTDEKPTIAIVLLGGNDALQKIPMATTKRNLSEIIDTLQKANVHVVLVGVLGGFPSDPYAPMFQELAKQYRVPFVSNILSGIIGTNSLLSDEVHPNDAGYAKVAARIAPAVERACAQN